MGTKPISSAMRCLFGQATTDWDRLPVGVGCTNATLLAIEKRDLIETRIQPGTEGLFTAVWQWRSKERPQHPIVLEDTMKGPGT